MRPSLTMSKELSLPAEAVKIDLLSVAEVIETRSWW
jgi:hypothetical protein